MLTIDAILSDTACTMALSGRLDAAGAQQLRDAALRLDRSVRALTLDMTALSYISSGGLRALLELQKTFGLRLTGVTEEVREILEVTGFIQFLKIA